MSKKQRSLVSLYLRVRRPSGGWEYLPAAYNSKGNIRPQHAVKAGVAQHFSEGIYHLRYRQDGKQGYQRIGTDASLATVALDMKQHELSAAAIGLQLVPSETGAVMPFLVPTAKMKSSAAEKQGMRTFTECKAAYLAEKTEHREKRTAQAYTASLEQFGEIVAPEYIEDIDGDDMHTFMKGLRARGCGDRTVRNRVDNVQAFLRHYGLSNALKKHELPRYTEKEVRAYNRDALSRMLEVADKDEADLLHFFLGTGTREQEVQFACWSDLDLIVKTYQVSEHLDLGFKPKDKLRPRPSTTGCL